MLFAWHPARVESVAWIAERKDALSVLLAWATLGAWGAYVRRPHLARFAATLGLFTASVLAKSMMVTLPLVLLLLDAWPLGRLGRGWRPLVREKLPFLAIAAMCAAVTYHVQAAGGAVAPVDAVGWGQRLANATVAWVRHLGLLAWPAGLAIFHPYRIWPAPVVAAAGATMVALSLGALAAWRRAPYVTVGWLWYVVTLLPVSGILQAGSQSMADRFTYLPSVGLAIAVVWTIVEHGPASRRARATLGVAAAALGVVLLAQSRRQVQTWRTSETVFRHALAVTADNYLAHNHLGEALAADRRHDEAMPHYVEAVRLNPRYPEAQNNLGNALARAGRAAEAEAYYRRAIALDPALPEAHNGLGAVLAERGDLGGAVTEYRAALAERPDYPEALGNLGAALRRQGDFAGAVRAYRRTTALRPEWLDARVGLARALAGLGRHADAEATLRDVLARAPDDPEATVYLAALLAERGAGAEARAALDAVLRRQPDFAPARELRRQLE
jgi:tetratricopeptide (TPR) repeat protein